MTLAADNESRLSHLDEQGRAQMVDVGSKDVTERRAVASGKISMQGETLAMLLDNLHPKGDVLAVARVAGISAAKHCWQLIPLCHQLPLSSVKIEFEPQHELPGVLIRAICKVNARTGVEMEAMTAVAIAGLTIYDMCKAVDREMVIGAVALQQKSGGSSGDWRRDRKDD